MTFEVGTSSALVWFEVPNKCRNMTSGEIADTIRDALDTNPTKWVCGVQLDDLSGEIDGICAAEWDKKILEERNVKE